MEPARARSGQERCGGKIGALGLMVVAFPFFWLLETRTPEWFDNDEGNQWLREQIIETLRE
ncbi:hypothetical protein [Cupriavidus sp. IDO]|uniref:hypothetical protein n=1 Tax=Cupriavidus sp. IDO TaxID=1539142 RepID=UPI0005791FB3|nr:hypothetical protein [Cupriavidus sp. IDO]KWR88388.1 hypothetical protein RM96_20125 [Cupriavidus sp. IDO]